jgi:hypothetical protein
MGKCYAWGKASVGACVHGRVATEKVAHSRRRLDDYDDSDLEW